MVLSRHQLLLLVMRFCKSFSPSSVYNSLGGNSKCEEVIIGMYFRIFQNYVQTFDIPCSIAMSSVLDAHMQICIHVCGKTNSFATHGVNPATSVMSMTSGKQHYTSQKI